MNRTPRNIHLLSQISDANPFKKKVARAFDIGSDYERDRESIFGKDERGVELRRDLSPEGKRDEAQKAIRRALRDLMDLRKPIEEYHRKTETMRAAAKRPSYDRTDLVAALLRKELRDLARNMSFGQRQMRMIGEHRDQNFIDALLELEPWCSGFDVHNPNELQLFEEARQDRLRDLNPALLDTIAARDGVEAEALMIPNIVRGDIAADSGLQSREFEAEVKAVESGINALWLKRDKDINGNEVTIVLVPEGQGFRGKIASPDEVRDGHFFASYEEYSAARAA
jgi:hypothetical protein